VCYLKKIKGITKGVFYYSGLANLMFKYRGRRLFVLCYHRVTGPGRKFQYLGVPRDVFEKQVLFLKRHFRIIPLKEAAGCLKGKGLDEPMLALTFDDGYRDNYLHAFPILKRHGVTATFFVPAGYIGTNERFWWDVVADIIVNSEVLKTDLDSRARMIDGVNTLLQLTQPAERTLEIEKLKIKFGYKETGAAEREIMSREEIKEISAYGFDFGSHTMTHANVTLLGEEALKKEILGSKQVLQEILGKEICGFAYPHGFYNEEAKRAVRECGYSYARTMVSGSNHGDEDVFALKCLDGGLYNLKELVVRLSYRGLI